ncbi:DUF7835 family putative zinc beta-ribbon protein [Halogeometricum limi]|uniref:DUF7835 domain-containing protein n=1 Tax=Halogeometricum limi TaxID=555875 RepID=A0A1I6HJD0_9EURY|nr:hypothetical protein [Halogeometricum limi]SFR54582.1 hypothetical protein SAMN04488124_2313 [Halogeometricum limi]
MSTTPNSTERTERCTDCGRDTVHRVRVELREEGKNPDTAAFSREPYRISICSLCGVENALRMNNA